MLSMWYFTIPSFEYVRSEMGQIGEQFITIRGIPRRYHWEENDFRNFGGHMGRCGLVAVTRSRRDSNLVSFVKMAKKKGHHLVTSCR